MYKVLAIFIFFIIFLQVQGFVWSQETSEGTGSDDSIDSLFTDGQQDTVVDGSQAIDVGALLSSPTPVLNGSIKVSGGIGLGWTSLDGIDPLVNNFSGFFGYDLSSTLSMNFRPSSEFRWAGTFSAALPAGTYTWSGISIPEMYIDYTIAESVFFTIGKFGYTWGVGRIFNVNDLLSGIQSGVSLKAVVPLGPVSITPLLMAQPSFFVSPTAPSYQEFGYAGMVEATLGPINIGLSGLYQKYLGPRFDLYLKAAALGLDLFAEARLSFPVNSDAQVKTVAGFFWEGLSPKVRLQAEYQFDSADGLGMDHSLSIAATLSAIPGTSLRFAAQWIHFVVDASGTVVLGMEVDPLPHMHLSFGIPLGYGAPGSRGVTSIVTQYFNQFGVGLKLELSASF